MHKETRRLEDLNTEEDLLIVRQTEEQRAIRRSQQERLADETEEY